MQKNDIEEAIPLLPAFERLLLETPETERVGWLLDPASLQDKYNRALKVVGRREIGSGKLLIVSVSRLASSFATTAKPKNTPPLTTCGGALLNASTMLVSRNGLSCRSCDMPRHKQLSDTTPPVLSRRPPASCENGWRMYLGTRRPPNRRKSVRLRGFEPPTYGLGNRCSVP